MIFIFPLELSEVKFLINLGLVSSSLWASYNFAGELQLPLVFVEL